MTTTPTSGAADLRATFSEILVDLPNTEPYTLFKAGFDAALAAGQATAAQAGAPANMQVTEKMRAAGDCAWMTADRVDSARVFRAMLAAAPAQPAAPPSGKTYEVLIHDLEVIASTAYAALPEYGINTASHAHFRVLGFTADQMRAFADATHALRASHGQAPAETEFPVSAQADSVQEDAARYQLLRRWQHWSVIDGGGNELLNEALDHEVDAARKQGEKQ